MKHEENAFIVAPVLNEGQHSVICNHESELDLLTATMRVFTRRL